jgi:hypothetical protein
LVVARSRRATASLRRSWATSVLSASRTRRMAVLILERFARFRVFATRLSSMRFLALLMFGIVSSRKTYDAVERKIIAERDGAINRGGRPFPRFSTALAAPGSMREIPPNVSYAERTR